MEYLKPVEPLNITSTDVYSEWKDWQDTFNMYTIASGLGEKDEKIILNTMLYMMGSAASKVFKLMTFPEGKNKDKVEDVVDQFERYFKGKSTNSSLRQAFKNRTQKSGESLIDYIENVQQLALTAGYKLEDSEVTDTITKGIMNRTVKSKLLDMGDEITIEKCIKICRSAQLTAEYFKQQDSDQLSAVNYAGIQHQFQKGSVHQTRNNAGIQQHFQQGSMHQTRNYGGIQPIQAQQQQFQQQSRNQQSSQGAYPGGGQRINDCRNCGLSHVKGRCPAYGKVCRACGKNNHFIRVCRSKRQSQRAQNVHVVEDDFQNVQFVNPNVQFANPSVPCVNPNDYDNVYGGASGYTPSRLSNYDSNMYTMQNVTDDMADFFVNSVQTTINQPCSQNVKQYVHNYMYDDMTDLYIDTMTVDQIDTDWNVNVKIGNRNLTVKIDTGAQCNVIGKSTFQSLGIRHVLEPSNINIRVFGGQCLRAAGQVTLPVTHKNTTYNVCFQVVDHEVQNILGARDSERMRLVQRVYAVTDTGDEDPREIIKRYPDRFTGLGCINREYEIRLRPDAEPVVHAQRKVPVPIRELVKKKLDEGVLLGIWEPVTEPTDWVNSMVYVSKPGGKPDDIRCCMDPKDLNKAIMREHYPLNTLENVVSKIGSSTVFTVLDLNQGFHQVPLKKSCRNLTCFNTPFGRYRYKRLAMGICSATEVFQKYMEDIFNHIEGVEIIVDDMLIHDTPQNPGLKGHNKVLIQVMEAARKNNVTFKIKKLRVGRSEVEYTGHTLITEGVQISKDKVKAIQEMPSPTSKEELVTQLAMMNYLSKYIKQFSELAAPLRELLKPDVEFSWHPKHDKQLKELKRRITEAPVLRYYSLTDPIIVSVDASSRGLGAVLLQGNKPVAYASKALTAAEQRYAQIEKETLAIVFGMDKFKQLVYGRSDVTIETDHKPLESIFSKPLNQAPMRIQKMRLKLQPYQFKVVWKPGKEIPVADALSRSHLPDYGETLINDEEMVCECIVESIPFSEPKQIKLKEETVKDRALIKLMDIIMTGWPENRQQTPSDVHPYWDYRDELAVYDGIVFRGDRVVIPQSMRPNMLSIIHQGHLGIVLSKRRARDVIFWPGMSSQIHDMVSKCARCLEVRNQQPKEPLKPHPVPRRPWGKIASDLFEVEGDHYLITADYYSDYFEIDELGRNTKSNKIVMCQKEHCARHGIPDQIMTDNGPQYTSSEFKQFTTDWGIEHHTSSPTFAQSNGFAEKNVQIAKKLILQCRKDKSDMYLALLNLRNVPRDDVLGSPVQRLMGRRTQTLLPTSNALLRPETLNPDQVHDRMVEHRIKQKLYYDRGAKELSKLQPGSVVRVQTKSGWQPGVIVSQDPHPRSYIVQMPETGGVYRRNRRHLLETQERSPVIPMSDHMASIQTPVVQASPMLVPQPTPNISMDNQLMSQTMRTPVSQPMSQHMSVPP